jgi:hypothetical protein
MVREGTRGDDQQQNHIFSYVSPEARVRKDHSLRAIRAMVDEVLRPRDSGFEELQGPRALRVKQVSDKQDQFICALGHSRRKVRLWRAESTTRFGPPDK